MTRLAVLGSPIAHSKSPALHAAAYRELALSWDYERVEMTGERLEAFIDGLSTDWRGLSLTMPLKRDVLPLLTTIDEIARLTGAANTVLFDEGERRGFNTDVRGIVRAFARSGVESLETVTILGAGATAASALAAARELGASVVTVYARDPVKAEPLERLARALELELVVRRLGVSDRSLIVPDAVVDTLPGGVEAGQAFAEDVRRDSVLLEVAYDPWPSPLVSSWLEVGGTVVDGLDMLIEQALVQVRIFVGGSPEAELIGEASVLAAMRAAVARS